MREISSGDNTLKIHASNMTVYFFEQQFHSELDDELNKIFASVKEANLISQSAESVSNITPEQMRALMEIGTKGTDDPAEIMNLLEKTGIDKDPQIISGLLLASNGGITPKGIPINSIMKVVWSLNQSASLPELIPAFDQWVGIYDRFNFVDCFKDICNEINDFFTSRIPMEAMRTVTKKEDMEHLPSFN